MSTHEACTESESILIKGILDQLGEDLSALIDRELAFASVEGERVTERPAGKGSIHISFRLGFKTDLALQHGYLLIPLADAISLAGCLLEIPEAGITSKRSLSTLDNGLKDAMVEIGNMIGGSASNALRALEVEGVKVRFTGCQGVRAGIRPALIYRDETPLIVGSAKGSLPPFPAFKTVIALPDLGSYLPLLDLDRSDS
ncbi:MAG: hypothetical protein ACI8QZ_002828 [Chlamydiales bacterium]|jgi:hypothetical protein